MAAMNQCTVSFLLELLFFFFAPQHCFFPFFSLFFASTIHKQVVYQSLERPPPPDLIPKQVENHVNTA